MTLLLILISCGLLSTLGVVGKALFLRGPSWTLPAFLLLLLLLPLGVYLPGVKLLSFTQNTGGETAFPLMESLLLIWVIGLLLSTLRFLTDLRSYHQWKDHAREVTETETLSLLTEITQAVGRSSPPQLMVSPTLSAPVLGGWLRPCIFLPENYQEWNPETLKMVLWHEVGHLARLDLWKQLLSRLAGLFYWFNPLLTSLRSTLTQQSELACDRWVIQQGVCRRTYLHALCDVAESSRTASPSVSIALSMADRAHLAARVESLVESSPRTIRKSLLSLVFLLFLTLLGASIVSLKAFSSTVPAEEIQLRLSANPFPMD